MAFRTVLIEKAKKVNLDLNSIVINYEDNNYSVCMDEISTIIFDDPMCNISLKLLAKLCEKNISIVFTDSSHNPIGTLNSLNSHSRTTKKLLLQISWPLDFKEILWTEIIKSKITNQIQTLKRLERLDKIYILEEYVKEIEKNDKTNREGLSSRIYFKELFGDEFKRFNDEIINWCLNYGYQIIRSKLAQEIVSAGYITNIGINHKSEYNYLNLADDFIEPYRSIIDYYIYKIILKSEYGYLRPEIKYSIVNILNEEILYDNKKMKLHISIQFYVHSLLSFMESGDYEKIKFPSLL